jgi:hypothetical protein
MLPGSLTVAIAGTKAFAIVFGNDMQTGTLIALGALLLLTGTILRHKYPSKQEDTSATPCTLWAKPVQPTAYVSSAGGAAHTASFSFGTTLERQSDRRPIGYLAIHSTPTTERRADLV